MPLSARIRARNVDFPPPIREKIVQRIAKLDEFFGAVLNCVVTVEGPGPHHRHGIYKVRVAISVPHHEIVIDHQAGDSLEIAVREAFAAADRRLEDFARRYRGRVKHHRAEKVSAT